MIPICEFGVLLRGNGGWKVSDDEQVLATWIHPVNVTVNDDVLVRMHLILDVSGPDCTTIPMNLSL